MKIIIIKQNVDSMMNQIDETRLTTKFQVKVSCWGGCNISAIETTYFAKVIISNIIGRTDNGKADDQTI